MRKGRLTEEQIIGVLREQEAGGTTAEVCRRHGVSEQTFYRWKAKYGGMGPSDAQRLKGLEDENRRLKKLLAESMLDVAALKDLLAKTENACGPAIGGAPADDGARLLAASSLQAARGGSEDGAPRRRGRRAGDPPAAARPGR